MKNKLNNLTPYFVLALILTVLFVWLKVEETTAADQVIRDMTQHANKWKTSDARKRLASPLIVDVRNSSEFGLSHCEGAINIPYEKLKEEIFLLVLDRKIPLLVYSRSLRISTKAVEYLKGMDYEEVYSLNQIAQDYERKEASEKLFD